MAAQKLHRLVVVNGLNLGEDYVLQDMHCTMGRASDNVVVVNTPSVSRYHARVVLTLNGPQVEDLNSTNGTFVNSAEVTRPVLLHPGDMLMLADAITLRYDVETHDDEATAYMGSGNFTGATVIETPSNPVDPFAQPAYTPPAMEYTPPPPPAQRTPVYDEVRFDDPAPVYTPPAGYVGNEAAPQLDEPDKPKRSRGLYILIGVLVILICLCVGVAAGLWFAPVEFWEWLFDLFGIQLPAYVHASLL